jgi:large subunit ribosomal protein L10
MPSAINELMLDELREALSKSPTLMLVDASKLKSDESLKFRKELRQVGARLKVAKSTVLQRVLPAGSDKVMKFRGPIGVVALGGDVAAGAKLVNDLAKEEKISVRGGVVEGKPLDAAQAAKLVDLPSREQISATLVRTLQAPLAQLVRMVNAKPQELVRLLKVKSEEASPAAAPAAG